MKKSKRKQKIIFNQIRSPYNIEGTDNSISDIYQRYIKDNDAIVEIDGLTYYKIIDLHEFRIRDASIMVCIDNKIDLKIGDKVIDENGTIYNVKSFEMRRMSYDVFPDWYFKINYVILDGNPYKMGFYLAKLLSDIEY